MNDIHFLYGRGFPDGQSARHGFKPAGFLPWETVTAEPETIGDNRQQIGREPAADPAKGQTVIVNL